MDYKIKIGIMFGCFIPFHSGHNDLIQQALQENNNLLLCVTGYDLDRGHDFIPFLRRVRLMREIFENDPRIITSEVDDKKIGLTGTFSETAWKTWCEEMFANASQKLDPNAPNIIYTWYTGEQRYIDKIKANYPAHQFKLIDRNINPISGTKVRENPSKYINEIHPTFVKYLERNYLAQ